MFIFTTHVTHYFVHYIKHFKGIAVGGELEYADEITLGRSITNRIPYEV